MALSPQWVQTLGGWLAPTARKVLARQRRPEGYDLTSLLRFPFHANQYERG